MFFVVDNEQTKGIDFSLTNYQAVIKGKKVDSSGKGLGGAEYKIFKKDDPNETAIPTTDQAGEVQNLIKTASDNFINYQGSAQFRKTNAANEPLQGAEFQVEDANGDPIGGVIDSDKDGYVTAENLAPGDYKLVEVKASTDYLLNKTEISFKIPAKAAGQPTQVSANKGANFINYQGSASLTKTDESGKKLANAEFNVIDETGNKVGETITSNKDGEVIANNLASGKYSFVEVKAPAGYLINTDPIPFEIATEAKGIPVQVKTNDGENFMNYQGSVQLKKVDFDRSEEDQGLKGATFIVQDEKGDQVGNAVESDEDGLVTVKNLAPGNYYLIEETAPEGFIINTQKIPFTIADHAAGEPKVVQANNDQPFANYKGTVQLIKQGVDGQRLPKAEFDLFREGETEAFKRGTTDANGVMTLAGLAPGNYRLAEVYAPAGYIVNETPIEFTIAASAEGQPAVVTANDNFINYQGSAKLIKQNKAGDPLKGAEFKVFNRKTNKRVGKTIRSNDEGVVNATKLAPGEYYFQEGKAPTSYVRNTTKVHFEIPEAVLGQPSLVPFVDPLINYRGQVQLTKVNAADGSKHLANAEVQLLDENKKVLKETLRTNKEGKLAVPDLAPGSYFFKETKAPIGHQLTQKLVAFTISK